MRLLQVIQTVDPAKGGPIEGIRQLAVTCKDLGVSVEVVSLDRPGIGYVRDFPVEVHALGPAYLGAYSYSPCLVRWLREHRENYDCIVVNGLWQYPGFAAHRALKNTPTPYVVFTHGMLDPWFKRKYPLKHLKKWLYWPWAEYRVLRDAAAVLFTSQEEMLLAPQSFSLYKVNAVVVGYGTRGPDIDMEAAGSLFLDEHPELRGKRVALFLGRIHPKKGCDLLIDAFARKLAEDPAWHLLMVGPDQLGWQPRLQKRAHELGIADRVTWVGMVEGSQKWGAFACAEIFVLPSHQENFGVVVAEALACSVPVLISNQINIWREVQAEGAGLAASDTLEGAETLLESWTKLPSAEREAMKNRCVEAFHRNFDIHTSSKTTISALQAVCMKSQRRPQGIHD